MHGLETLFSKEKFSAVPNRFKKCQNAYFRDIIFKKISVVLNRFKYVRMHALETLFSFVSLKLQVVSNTIRIVQTSKTIERKKVGCYTKTRVNHIWVDL